MAYRYHVYGLTLESALECPELAPAPPEAAVDVRIDLARLPPTVEGAVPVGRRVLAAPGIYQIWVEGIARFRAEWGQQIWVDPVPGAEPADIRAYLLGPVLGITVLLRGRLPLHASAVRVNGGAYAFCGDSGAGKSTLAAALYRRGMTLLTDDLGVAIPGQDGVMFYPGFPRIKLWRTTLEHFAMDSDALSRDLSRAEKFHWPIQERHGHEPLPLRRLYVLERSADDETRIEPVRGSAAMAALSEHTFGAKCVRHLDTARHNLTQCGGLAESIEIFRYHRPWRLDRLAASLTELLDHIS